MNPSLFDVPDRLSGHRSGIQQYLDERLPSQLVTFVDDVRLDETAPGRFYGGEQVLMQLLRSDEEIRQRFALLVERWETDTTFSSATDEILLHPDYQRILALGIQVVPLILEQLRDKPRRWLWALKVLVDENPAERAADADAAVDAWMAWGRARGLVDG
ncbi:MAG TPA: hypothetical protein VGO48_05395 [Conexibacter sp.]|jgi:hypothetical protein|nr:hypothetical protein [Conexibacter sp.]